MLDPIYLETETGPAWLVRPGRKRLVFGWYGGKFSHLSWLLPLLPPCHHYVEPFGGSAAVLLNRSASTAETYNDIDGELVNFFRVLRDDLDTLHRVIGLTPFSREEFCRAIYEEAADTAIEKARRFYIRARQVRSGLCQTASLGRWAYHTGVVRNDMPGGVSRWLGGIEALSEIAERLLRVQIENRPALDVISTYDAADTLFYCDPPYLANTRGGAAYAFEMDEAEHAALAECLATIKGKAAISGYRCDQMDTWYADWRRYDGDLRTNHITKGVRQESVWMNY